MDKSTTYYIAFMSGVLCLVAISFGAYQWNAAVTTTLGQHVASLEQVLEASPTSFSELEEEYGVRVSLVATSMAGSIIDVRIKIIDPVKAHALLQNQAALLVGQQALILAPHMHSHNTTRLKPGKVFVLFFPTQQIISTGSQVSLIFGRVRSDPVIVQ